MRLYTPYTYSSWARNEILDEKNCEQIATKYVCSAKSVFKNILT